MALVKSGTKEVAEDVAGKTIVYIAKDEVTKKVIYVGITDEFAKREAAHLTQKGIQIEELLPHLSRADARAVEQVLIELYGLGGKPGQAGQLLNKINSIAKTNPIYSAALKRGLELLQSIGFK